MAEKSNSFTWKYFIQLRTHNSANNRDSSSTTKILLTTSSLAVVKICLPPPLFPPFIYLISEDTPRYVQLGGTMWCEQELSQRVKKWENLHDKKSEF